MSIQVKCNGCDRVIETSAEPWFEAAYFDPREMEEETEEAGIVHHLCSPECVSVWGARIAMDKFTGPVL